ncbi:unnamed protein product [Didymodactylos carnosus]|uniref:Uncharacterized protein n=1 Tax=Didymodactylos carnosus TaxID=1234261 RepID=A0A815VFI0_9BILA|nr:unnamed protein product [Didymodactylos carnosus]CAF1535108.1 unnamed protein product [Didymodactylos carnosus]CAF3643076.1 unnamed protein product [Didymodactylos carnosus]CAF4394755.1 unnamed protein product [Didymodactylos carnosus]
MKNSRTARQYTSVLSNPVIVLLSLKNDAITKSIATNHNPKLPDNVQNVLTGLKRRVLIHAYKPTPKIYGEERHENGTAATVAVSDAWRSTLYSVRKTILPPIPILIDFEKAAIDTINDVFPQTLVKGCISMF